MIKKMLGWGGTLSLLTLAACGGSVQEIGDALAGSGGSGAGTAEPHAGSGGSIASSTHGGASPGGLSSTGAPSHGGSASNSGPCNPACGEGFGCYPVANDPGGFCAPLCDTQEQGQTPDADLSCSNSVRGGAGQCVFSQGYGWAALANFYPAAGGNVVTGLCSNPCDPLAQDCPVGYTCDHTDTYSAFNQQGLYACMPNKDPRALDAPCDRTGDGQCGPGLTCSLPSARCVTFCDMNDPSTCPTDRTCTEDEITIQDNDPNIGVCL
jgi:hypothetical protein